jgi:hypothetical protein
MTARATLRLPPSAYQPKWSDPCPCGSGKTFQACCRARLPDFKGIDNAWREAAEQGDWEGALLCVRADVAQYVIWHRRHTEPVMKIPGRPPVKMVAVDVAALSEHVRNLIQCLSRLDRLNQAPAVLIRLRNAIDDERWHRKIVYHKAFAALMSGDRVAAGKELAAAGPITLAEDDVDLLQIHIDLNGSDLGFTDRQGLYHRVVEITHSRSDEIQYRGAAAFDLLLVGDEKGGRAAMEATVAAGRTLEAEKPLSNIAESWFCRSLETLAVIDRDAALFKELVDRLTRLLTEGDWTATGRAELLRSIGDAHRYAGDFKHAADAYRRSLGEEASTIVRVYEAESLLRGGSVSDALQLIRAITTDGLDAPEVADHAFVFSYIALEAKDPDALRQADRLLRAAVTPHPYFQTQRLQHIITVQEALAALAEKREPPKIGGLLRALSALSRYVQLQPNFNGIGINFNNIIDDAVERAERKARDEDGQ